jgi:hypothetical protein
MMKRNRSTGDLSRCFILVLLCAGVIWASAAERVESGRQQKEDDVKELFEKVKDEPGGVGVVLSDLRLEEGKTLYIETRGEGGRRRFFLDEKKVRFKPFASIPSTYDSDAGRLVEMVNKMAEGKALSPIEEAFLDLARPVFRIRLKNMSKSILALTAIHLRITKAEGVAGGGQPKPIPDIRYDIEVPTTVGVHTFKVEDQPLILEVGQSTEFLIALKSSNRTRLDSGIVISKWINYVMELWFAFGRDSAKTGEFEVLL